MFVCINLLVSFIYWLNQQFRYLSDLFIGTVFEPKFDIVLITAGFQAWEDSLFYILPCDVSDRQQILQTQRMVHRDVGIVTVLINNAGIATGKTINLLSSFYTIKAFLPDMILKNRGYIVTIASVLGYMSPARLSAYGASKSGLIALHESLTYELGTPYFAPHGIKTLLVCPGQLKTGMFLSIKTPSTLLAPELDPNFPWPIVALTRKLCGIDQSMTEFKAKLTNFSLNGSNNVSAAPEVEYKGLFIIVHGWTEHILMYKDVAKALSSLGYSCFAFDLREHGKTEETTQTTPVSRETSIHGQASYYFANRKGPIVSAKSLKKFFDALPLDNKKIVFFEQAGHALL
ncbi:hypothetical protein Cantr_01202 [Candida viswanathii]|uniref:Serine aminopeptidase S33 domain-containing protein n=1 Tax=Candida viswanathii TaxID=5486 RepID=A0A367YHE9_9ASCO|nr:hypothetical protein Cantr_01202 [Candida viswanathii]